MSFSEKFNSKPLRAAKKSHDALFNGLGEKIHALGLDEADEKFIMDKLETMYVKKRLELETQAALGTLPEPIPKRVKKVAPVVVTEPVGSDNLAQLAEALGSPVKTGKTTKAKA